MHTDCEPVHSQIRVTYTLKGDMAATGVCEDSLLKGASTPRLDGLVHACGPLLHLSLQMLASKYCTILHALLWSAQISDFFLSNAIGRMAPPLACGYPRFCHNLADALWSSVANIFD